MKELKRLQVGEFNIKNAITLKQLEEQKENAVILIEDFLQSKEKIILNNKQLERFLNGVKLKSNKKNNIYRIYTEQSKFIGIGIVDKDFLKRDLII